MDTPIDRVLSRTDIEQLTKAKHARLQREILDAKGIGYLIGADGRPVTTWTEVHRALAEPGSGVNG